MSSFFFAFLLYSKILYYSIRNKSRNLVQIFVDFNQLKYKNAHFLILNIKKENQKTFSSDFCFSFFRKFHFKIYRCPITSQSAYAKMLQTPLTVPQFHPLSALLDPQEQLLSHLQAPSGLPQAAVQPLQRHSLKLPVPPHHPQVSDNW